MKRHRRSGLVVLIGCAALFVWSCQGKDSPVLHRVSRLLMGTLVEISVVGEVAKAKQAAQAIIDEMQRVEDLTSFHKASKLTEINDHAGKGPFKANSELLALIGEALRTARETGGAFDPTVGALTRLWNFSEEAAPRLPTGAEITDGLTKVGWQKVKIDPEAGTILLPEPGMALDLGGIAKSYGLDRAAAVARKLGVAGALVNAGGDIIAVGEKQPGVPWRIGVQDPRDRNAIAATTTLKDGVVATSGDYERFFIKDGKRYHHILDPRTGYPAEGLQSVTLAGSRGVITEPLALAIFVLGPDEGLKRLESAPGVQGFVIDSQGRVRMSSGAAALFEMKR